MEWVGHRDSKIVALYRHLRPEDGVKQMSQINFLGEQPAHCEPVRSGSDAQHEVGPGGSRASTAPAVPAIETA